jgi:hypothetical protein
MTDYAHSVRALEQRERKALLIARCCTALGASARVARALDAPGRRALERAAAIPVASDETWEIAFRCLDIAEESVRDAREGLPKGVR